MFVEQSSNKRRRDDQYLLLGCW